MSEEGEQETLMPPEIVKQYENAKTMLLPPASKEKYNQVHRDFIKEEQC